MLGFFFFIVVLYPVYMYSLVAKCADWFFRMLFHMAEITSIVPFRSVLISPIKFVEIKRQFSGSQAQLRIKYAESESDSFRFYNQ